METSVRRRLVGTALLNHSCANNLRHAPGNQGEIRLQKLRNILPTLSQLSATKNFHLLN